MTHLAEPEEETQPGRLASLAHAAWRHGRHAGARLADLVLPPQCLITGEAVGQHGTLSPAAWASLGFIDAPLCGACGLPWESQIDDGLLCAACTGAEHEKGLIKEKGLDRVRAALRYDDVSAKLALQLKYADRLDTAAGIGRIMAQAGRDLLADDGAILVPVPLHRRRLVSRRFNQAAVLAGAIARQSSHDLCLDALRRTRATPRQQGLSAKGRARNMKGAFDIPTKRRDVVRGAHIILIDDVLTTGSTLKACARRLKRGGAARVEALVLARVVPEGIGAI